MTTTIINAGIDFGNSHTKFAKGSKEICFESGYKMYATTTGDEDEMLYNGNYYIFGERASVEFDKTASDRMMLCTLRCIAEHLEYAGADPAQVQFINLGVDIPISLFGAQRAAYAAYYADKLEIVRYHGKEWKIQFERVHAFPQGVITWMADIEKYKQYDTVAVLDIGGRTIDVAVVTRDQNTGKNRFLKRFSLQKGVIKLIADIDMALNVEGMQLSELQIQSLIAGNEVMHRRYEKIREIVDTYTNAYVDDVVNSLYENEVDADLAFILVGGGADLISRFLQERIWVIENTGNMANARACEKALNSALAGNA